MYSCLIYFVARACNKLEFIGRMNPRKLLSYKQKRDFLQWKQSKYFYHINLFMYEYDRSNVSHCYYCQKTIMSSYYLKATVVVYICLFLRLVFQSFLIKNNGKHYKIPFCLQWRILLLATMQRND